MIAKASHICFALLIAVSWAVCANPACAGDEDEEDRPFAQLDLRGAKALHPLDIGGESVEVQESEEHFVYMVEDALKAMGKEQDIAVFSSPKFKNGVAYIINNTKLLVMDENELEVPDDATGERVFLTNAIALLTLGHEIGHHVCEHLTKNEGTLWQQELEADEVAGAILVNQIGSGFYSLKKSHIMSAARKSLGSEEGSESHPPLKMRLAAVEAGWKTGAKCGGLKTSR